MKGGKVWKNAAGDKVSFPITFNNYKIISFPCLSLCITTSVSSERSDFSGVGSSVIWTYLEVIPQRILVFTILWYIHTQTHIHIKHV